MSRTYILERQMKQLLSKMNITLDAIEPPPDDTNYTPLYIAMPILLVVMGYALYKLYNLRSNSKLDYSESPVRVVIRTP